MEDNKEKQNNTNSNEQPKEQPKVVTINLSEGKTREEIKNDALSLKKDFGSAGVDDINKNVGSFTNTVKSEQAQSSDIKLDFDNKVIEKASKEKIDFDKFSKTRKDLGAPKTKFGEKIGLLLRNKQSLKKVWIIEILSMLVIIAIAATLIGLFTKYKNWTGDGPMHLEAFQACLKTGLVFLWISMFPCVAPLVYLLTTWFIGINEVHASKIYHYFFWIAGAVSLLCFVVGLGVMMKPIVKVIAWQGDKIIPLLSLIK